MISLNLFDRPAEGSEFKFNLDGMFSGWRRSKRAIGGYHLGKFAIRNRGIHELTNFYNSWLGYKLVEYTFGIISFEGIALQLDLIKNGTNYRRTLNSRYWHNRVKVRYTNPEGSPATINWSANTDSSGIYGEMEYILSVGEATSTGATAERDRELVDYAWPQSSIPSGVSIEGESPDTSGNGLLVTVAGFMTTMNWQYRETSETAAASTLLSTLIGETEFVTAGRIETNSTSVRVGGDPGRRIGDLAVKIIKKSDASGNLWKGGVYANQKFIYEQLPITVDYELRDGLLYNSAGILVNPALLNPGFYIRDANAPWGIQPPGTSNIWNDPQVHYCNEIEYIWPNALKLKFSGSKSTVILTGQAYPDVSSPHRRRGPQGLPDISPPPIGIPGGTIG
jgi:hypothetical protein